jgi:hypothetical protein
MHSNSMRLLKLINDLLDLVRLESGKMEIKLEPVEIAEFVKGLASSARQMANDKRLLLETSVDLDLGEVLGDRDKLDKILRNLLFNALKFTPAGGKVEMVEKKTGMALAFMSDFPFSSGGIQLLPGDTLVLYTDGVNEAMNIDNKLFTAERIQSTLESLRDGESAEVTAKAVIQNVAEFVGDAPQSDDITILVVRYTGNSGS